ncbi:L-lactate permease [Ectobacillus funiculus]|uniref:L-lactate permease n=1 Tax=Ectobacillus funiculus TaxID=137993 RepID=A0ABV5WPY1_9BACI
MEIFLALSPILSIFLFLFAFKQTSFRSAIFSYFVCLGIVLLFQPFQLHMGEILHATAKGALICFIVAYVLFFGIFLFHLMNQIGLIQSIASFVSDTTNDRMMQTLLICFGICPLIESASGFGIGFMVAAPIFLSLGYPPFQAALLSFIGLLASSWGALATGTIIGSQLVNIPLSVIGSSTAILSTPIFAYMMITSLYIVGGWRAVQEKWLELLGFFLLFSLSIFLFSKYVSVELAGILSPLMTIAFGFIRIKASAAKRKVTYSQSAASLSGENRSIIKILSPYLFLTVCILLSRLIPNVSHTLQSTFILDLPSYSYKLALLYSPGFWLGLTCMFTIMLFHVPFSIVKQSLCSTVRQWIPFAVTTTMFISISEIMGVSGMHQLLAQTAGDAFGKMFMIVTPFIGAIGGFLTGSNAGSNAMFIKLQVQTAQHVGLSWQSISISQNASSSISTIACPSRITLGAYLCNIPSRENELLRTTTLMISGAVMIVLIETVSWLTMFQ